ncbi:kelch domain-containing protein 3 [Bradysia coprophila]|uniref:kelch domain-containing protein 3 n=1 Tax=Bradysia coprophila TaxID=38358 RepID=UPI00187DCE7B|nr:kelch domain-containing protein 3 [Bradysia coprophila]XP_037024422.1 kelch domain-containing protein 3 [Bradysia coprophila]
MYWIAHLDGGPCRVNHTAVVVGDFIYSFGGYCSSDEYKLNHTIDVHVLNTHNLRWFLIPPKRDSTGALLEYPAVPFQRYGHSAVAYKQKVYMWGGRNDEMCCSILFCFDTITHQWSKPEVNGEIPAVRDGHTACIVDHNMYIFGGFEEQANRFSCDVHCLNLETMTWSYLSTTEQPPSYRDFHTATVLDNKMYIFGGRGDRHSPFHTQEEIYCDQLVYLDLSTRKWTKPNATGSVPLGRRSHSAFVYNKQLYVFGGYNSIMEKHFNDLYCYNPSLNRWSVVTARGVPPRPRRRQVCLVIDKRMYLFGGTSPYAVPIHSSNRQNLPLLLDYSDIHVFDFEPTLKTLAIRAVLDYEIDQSLLPQCIRSEIRSMTMSNTISRPLNSTG